MPLHGEAHPNAKLNSEQVKEIRKLYKQGFSKKTIARNYKVTSWNITQIVKRKTWIHI